MHLHGTHFYDKHICEDHSNSYFISLELLIIRV